MHPLPGEPRSPSATPARPVTGPRPRAGGLLVVGALLLGGCGAESAAIEAPKLAPLAQKWLDRAQAGYRSGDLEDAATSAENALRAAPGAEEVKLVGARIALAQLEYDRCLQLLTGVETPEAAGLRGRALWYAGRIDQAAEELERLLADPEVKDPWATEVAKLARRGAGRKPFTLAGGLLAVTEMPMVADTWMVVPVEVNGEPALAALATGSAETLIDSSGGSEAQWVSLRFGESVEVKDVPALPKDLSGLSRQLNGAPLKLLIGVNLLRHLHPTFDFLGGQFVVRTFDPPPPPQATTVRVGYVRGGGMVMRGGFGAGDSAPMASLMIDTTMTLPVLLADSGMKKAGLTASGMRAVNGQPKLRQGMLAALRLGAFEIPQVPAFYGITIDDMAKELQIDLDGMVGSSLLAPFRVTLVDRGRTMWLEDLPAEAVPTHSLIGRPVHAEPEPTPEPAEPEPAEAAPPPAGSATP